MKPAIPLTDARFVWTSACATDISKRFAAARERLACERMAELARDKALDDADEAAKQALQTPVADCAAIARIFDERRGSNVIDLDGERQFREWCDVSAGKK